MKETKQKISKGKVIKKLFLFAGLPLLILVLIFGWYFIYNLPATVSRQITEELNKYDFGSYTIEAIAVRHDKTVLGPIVFGEGDDCLKAAQVKLEYTFSGIRKGEINSITVSGADIHLNRHGNWQLAGLEGLLRGIANYQKANPSNSKSTIPLIKVETSLLTLHYQGRQYSFPLAIDIKNRNDKIIFDVQTNLSRDHLQNFSFELDPESLSLELKLDAFNLDIAQAGHFLQKFGMKDSQGTISVADISLTISKEKFNVGGKIQIQNFKTVYNDEGKPVTLTFDRVDPVTVSRNLKDSKAVFKDVVHFHNLAYSYGTYLFKAEDISSKVHFDIGSNIYKTDSKINKATAHLNGSEINSLSEIALKLNWSDGELQSYAAKGKMNFSYSGGIVEGITEVDVDGSDKELKAEGGFEKLKIPNGSVEKGTFNFSKIGTLLKLDVNLESFAILGDTLKGDSRLTYKKENDLVDISGSLNKLQIFERFAGNAELSVKESKENLQFSLKNFELKTTKGDFEIALNADLTLPVSFDHLLSKPLDSEFILSSSVGRLKINEVLFKPFKIKADSDREAVIFSADTFEAENFPYLKISAVNGKLNLDKRQADINFETLLNFEDLSPAYKVKVDPVQMDLKLKENDGILNLELNDKVSKSLISCQDENLKLIAEVKHESLIKANIPLDNFLNSAITSFKSSSQVTLKELKSDRLEIDNASLELKLNTENTVDINNYLDLSLRGSLNQSINSLSLGLKKSTAKEMEDLQLPQWKETLNVNKVAAALPFNWNIRKGFSETVQNIKIGTVSHSRWVDGGDFLGYFPKEVSIEKLNLTAVVKGLQLAIKEQIQLTDKLSVNMDLLSGWEIPEPVVNGNQSPLSFLAKLALVPEHDFTGNGSLKIADAEISELAAFVKEPISEDNILKGKVSAEVTFSKNKDGLKIPALIEIKNTRAYFVGENDSYVKIKGLRGKLKFESLIDLRSEDSQYLRVDFFEAPGLKLDKTLIKYKIYSPEKVRIMRLNTTWCGGKIEGADILFNPAHQSLKCTVYASKVEMEQVMELMKGVECKANGSLYGRLILELRNGKVMDQDGFLYSEPGTELSLQMQGDNVIYDSITDVKTRKLLSNLKVDYFKILFKGGEDIDNHKTIFKLKGTSAVGDPPNPLDLSINFNGPVIYYLQLPLHEKGIKDFIEKKTKEKK